MKNNNHYTDDDFQNYLDHIFEGDIVTFESHLRDCDHCNENFQAYNAIWSLAKTEMKTDSLKIDLATIVVRRVMPDTPKRGITEIAFYGLYILLGCVCLISCISYLASNPIPVSFLLLLIPIFLYFLLAIKEMKLLSQKYGL